MLKLPPIFINFCVGLLFFSLSSCSKSLPEKPNIIIILTDDQGYADLACQGILNDVYTPHIDKMASKGVRFTAGYATAPQCTPSRAAIITGKYQQKFGVDDNSLGPLPLDQRTIAEHIKTVGYKTGIVGKWDLNPEILSTKWMQNNPSKVQTDKNKVEIPYQYKLPYQSWNRGFDEVFQGNYLTYLANSDLKGRMMDKIEMYRTKPQNRIDIQTEQAMHFINRNKNNPFFLYLSYFAPHVPLTVSEKYLKRFSTNMPSRRRHALALIAAMDDGIGKINKQLEQLGIDENTLIFFMSDNGAPMGLTMNDDPINDRSGIWDGSKNDPYIGEKGMLTEGGIRVPFIAYWPGIIPSNQVINEPVITLDATKTAAALAGLDLSDYDGINLIPFLRNPKENIPDRLLFWRWKNQEAVRNKQWKYMRLSNGDEFVFDIQNEAHENINSSRERRDVAKTFGGHLKNWSTMLQNPRMKKGPMSAAENTWYNYYFEKHLNQKKLVQ